MPKPRWLRSLIVPASILSILFVAFIGYYMYWVPSRQRLLDDRGFRYLKTLSDQIRLSLNTYDKMMDNAVNSGHHRASSEDSKSLNEGVTRKNLEKFLTNVAPQLTLAEDAEIELTLSARMVTTTHRKSPIKADEGTHFLYFAFSHELDDWRIHRPENFRFRRPDRLRSSHQPALGRSLPEPV